jgi:hypothetical protein
VRITLFSLSSMQVKVETNGGGLHASGASDRQY